MDNFNLEKLLSENYCDTLNSLEPVNKERFYNLYRKPNFSAVKPKLVAVCVAVILILGMVSGAYAADVGGIKSNIRIWIHGTQKDAVTQLQPEDQLYTITYEDSDGEVHEKRIGSIMYEDDGSERAITEDEIVSFMNMPDVEYRDDGTIWVYYHSQSIEITDKFDDNGIGYVQIEDGEETLYLTIVDECNYACSHDGFPSPDEFHNEMN